MEPLTTILIIVFIIAIAWAYYKGHQAGTFERDRHWESELPKQRKEAISQSRSVLSGQFSEQLAPFLPDFKHSPTECRFIGKPIDLIVFKGMDEKEIKEVIFVEVKSGNSKLSPIEKSLKETIEKRNVKFEEYRIPLELTKERNP